MRLALVSVVAVSGLGWSQAPFWAGTSYDPGAPTFEKVLGYGAGERISWHAGVVRYLEALAAAQPQRMKVWEYGKTWEGRRLIYAAVGSEANMRRLEEIKAGYRKLADPRVTGAEEARRLAQTLPAVIWLGYGVHGNEISSPDAAMLVAYHLLAARRDAVVEKILANVVVLIDPLQNPDGRDRFVHHFEQSEGLEPDANPVALEHTEGWLSGRTNHYHFDLNRDWLAQTQPETRGRVKTLREWLPLVFVDLHEMGSDSTYYFAPEAVPYNPHLTGKQRASLEWFGKNNAKWFDANGFAYFTREVYDAFYPGYGASWPAYYGAIAMTYEQASARGLLMRRSDETVFSFRDTVRQHFVASIATCETAAERRRELLENFYEYRRTAIEEGAREEIKEYALVRKGDVSAVDKLARLLVDFGVEVYRAPDRYLIPLNQPAKRMIRTLLDAQVNMEPEFVKEQERLRKKKLPDEIYDVTAWSLPLLFNVELVGNREVTAGRYARVGSGESEAGGVSGKAEVAYLTPWGTQAAARWLTAALRANLRVHSTDKSFRQGERTYPRGTLIVRVKENGGDVHEKVAAITKATGAEVVATNSGWVEEGVNFGSRYVVAMKKPAIAIAWEEGASPASAGHTRFVLERQYGYPTTPVRTRVLANADLGRFQVIVLPGGEYGAGLRRKLGEWVSAGGTLVALGEAVGSLLDAKEGLLAVQQEDLPKPEGKKVEGTRIPGTYLQTESDYEKAIQAEAPRPDAVAGVLVKAQTDGDHWVTAGAPPVVQAMITGRGVYTPVTIDQGVNAAVFLGPNELLASGYLWEENRKLLAYKPLVVAQRRGRGWVIGFTADPNFRAYLDGMNLLFLNAVFRGPAHAR
jgi:hypothetical protein